MTDHLAALEPPAVAAWYRRLADHLGARKIAGAEPLSSTLLRAWIDNRDATAVLTFPAPAHLAQSQYTRAVQAYHRRVFLTQERARIGEATRWAGILPRLQALPGFAPWDGTRPLELTYESLVEIPLSVQLIGSDEDKDLLYALRGFQLRSEVRVSATSRGGARAAPVEVQFVRWQCSARDRYDFDPSEHITVPNPDFGSRAAGAVRPGDQKLTVYHRNAERLQKARLAAPYDLIVGPWDVVESAVTGPARVDPARRL